MSSDIEQRLRAVERSLTDGETTPADLEDAASVAADLETQAQRLETLEDRVDDLDAAVQALRGYVGEVRSVNREVERRAEAAIAAVENDSQHPDPPHPVPETDDEGVFARVGEWL